MLHWIKQAEKREGVPSMVQETRVTWLLLAILALALGLRVWGIGFGLPYDLTYDEGKEVHRAFKLGVGEYYWGFGKGGLYYLLFVEYGLLYVFWWVIGHVGDTHEFALQVLRDPSIVFLLGRWTVAIMGTLTCLVVFLIGRRLYDWRVGLGAAFIGATAYSHGMISHKINVDIGMVLAVWGSILAYLEYEKREERRWLIGTGVLAGVAIAFKLPGAIILPALFLAIGSQSERWRYPRRMVKEAGIVLLTTMVTLTVVAPAWTMNIGSLHKNFSSLTSVTPTGTSEGNIRDAIKLVGRVDAGRTGYLKVLLKDYNLALTLTTLLGGVFAVLRRQRWSVILCVLIALFLVVMSAADGNQPEHYLLPIMPAMWLLSSQAIAEVSRRHWWLNVVGLILVVFVSFITLVRQDVEWTKADTRVLAKEWMEANVPSGAKILMDGYQYRFVPSPPLTPNKSTVLRQIAGVSKEGKGFARGVSQRTLRLYGEAMERVEGPSYELHSTVWGLAVEDPTYYVQGCFDFIITSSIITKRYARESNRKRFPKSARFYEQLNTNPRFRKVYSVEPLSWKRTGPTITVYRVLPSCETSHSRHTNS